LRLQQYIEMIRTGDKGKLVEARAHARKYLTPFIETQSAEIHRAAGLLAFPKDTKAEPYKVTRPNVLSHPILTDVVYVCA
jgi:macrophage erythroblast attacher